VWAMPGFLFGVTAVAGLLQPKSRELIVWGIAGAIWGAASGRFARGMPFQHGFLLGFLGGMSACIVESIGFGPYLANNPAIRDAYGSLGQQFQLAPSLLRLAPVMSGLFLSGVYGCVVGGIALLAARIWWGQRAA